jgi:hypothetical protein
MSAIIVAPFTGNHVALAIKLDYETIDHDQSIPSFLKPIRLLTVEYWSDGVLLNESRVSVITPAYLYSNTPINYNSEIKLTLQSHG